MCLESHSECKSKSPLTSMYSFTCDTLLFIISSSALDLFEIFKIDCIIRGMLKNMEFCVLVLFCKTQAAFFLS